MARKTKARQRHMLKKNALVLLVQSAAFHYLSQRRPCHQISWISKEKIGVYAINGIQIVHFPILVKVGTFLITLSAPEGQMFLW